jgi:hypothetical protein
VGIAYRETAYDVARVAAIMANALKFGAFSGMSQD